MTGAPTLDLPVRTVTGHLVPESVLATHASQTAAARWHCSAQQPTEIFAPAQGSRYIVSIIQSLFAHETFYDGKLTSHGQVRRGDINIVPIDVAPRAIIPEGFDLLHIYLPADSINACASACGFDPVVVEIVNPANQQDREISQLSETLLSEMRSADAFSALRLDVLAQDLSLMLLRRWSTVAERQPKSSRRSPSLAPWQVKRITTKLHEEIDRDVGLSELAELVGLSETYLCTAFRNASGLPPHQWQKQARVERAKELLASSALSVTEVALEVGYSNPGHFATMFRTATGLTPRAWRKERAL